MLLENFAPWYSKEGNRLRNTLLIKDVMPLAVYEMIVDGICSIGEKVLEKRNTILPASFEFNWRYISGMFDTFYNEYREPLPMLALYGEDAALKEFIASAVEHMKAYDTKIRKEAPKSKLWEETVLKSGIKEELVSIIDQFQGSRDFYVNELGVSWKVGIILYGPPGNGKTRIIKGLRELYGIPLKDLNDYIRGGGRIQLPTDFADEDCCSETEEDYKEKRSSVISWGTVYRMYYPVREHPIIITAEDLEKIIAGNGDSDSPLVRLSEFLNAVDGVHSTTGTILIGTSNDLTRMVEAVLARPGRFDHLIKIDNPDAETLNTYFEMRKLSVKNTNLGEHFNKEQLSMAFAEQLVIWAKTSLRKSILTKTEFDTIFTKMKNHMNTARKMSTKVTKNKKNEPIGFDR